MDHSPQDRSVWKERQEALRFVFIALAIQIATSFVVVLLGVIQVNHSTYERMNGTYSNTLYDTLLEGTLWVLWAPISLLCMIFPGSADFLQGSWLVFGLNEFLTGSLLLCARAFVRRLRKRR